MRLRRRGRTVSFWEVLLLASGRFSALLLIGLVMANHAACRSTHLAMAGHVASDTANDRPF